MTVKQLITKLKKCPQDATVTITNNALYLDGEYKVTEVEVYDDTVEIATDYKHRAYPI